MPDTMSECLPDRMPDYVRIYVRQTAIVGITRSKGNFYWLNVVNVKPRLIAPDISGLSSYIFPNIVFETIRIGTPP